MTVTVTFKGDYIRDKLLVDAREIARANLSEDELRQGYNAYIEFGTDDKQDINATVTYVGSPAPTCQIAK
jgi:hypothetical protein